MNCWSPDTIHLCLYIDWHSVFKEILSKSEFAKMAAINLLWTLSLFLDVNSTYSNGTAIFDGIPKGWASSSDRRQLCYESVHKLCVSHWQVDKTLTNNNYSKSSTWRSCLLFKRYQRNRKNKSKCCFCHCTKTLFLRMHFKTLCKKKSANEIIHYNTINFPLHFICEMHWIIG